MAALAVAPTLTWTTPASDGISYDWGEATTLAVSVSGGTGTVTGITYALGAQTPIAMTDGGGGSWSKVRTWLYADIGAAQTLTATATTSDGLTVTATRTVTIVDVAAAYSLSYYDLRANTTTAASTVPALSSWTASGLSGWSGTGMTEDSATGSHYITTNISGDVAGPETFVIDIKPEGRTYAHVYVNAVDKAGAFNLSGAGTSGTIGTAVSASITNLGDGYYRCTVKYTNATAGSFARVYIATGMTGPDTTVAGNSSLALTVRSPTVTQQRASQQNPKTGTMGTLAQATAAAQPFLWDGTNWTQASGLYFSGSSVLRVSGSGSVAQPYVRLYVARYDGTTGTSRILGGSRGTDSTELNQASSGKYAINAGTITATATDTPTTKNIVGAYYDGAASKAMVNSAETTLNPGTNGSDGLCLGGNSGSASWLGQIEACIVGAATLDAAARTRLKKALAAEHGVTLA